MPGGTGSVTHEVCPGSTAKVHDFGFVPVPRRLQYDPAQPAKLGLFLNVMFGVVSTVGGLIPLHVSRCI